MTISLASLFSAGMSRKVSHVMLTGPPGIGKTTAVKQVHRLLVEQFGIAAKGFYTEEVREHGRCKMSLLQGSVKECCANPDSNSWAII